MEGKKSKKLSPFVEHNPILMAEKFHSLKNQIEQLSQKIIVNLQTEAESQTMMCEGVNEIAANLHL